MFILLNVRIFKLMASMSISLGKVSKPLDVKTKFFNVEEDILLEVQIQNTTMHPMFLEKVNFDPTSGFLAWDLNLRHLQRNRDTEGGKEAELDESVDGEDSLRCVYVCVLFWRWFNYHNKMY